MTGASASRPPRGHSSLGGPSSGGWPSRSSASARRPLRGPLDRGRRFSARGCITRRLSAVDRGAFAETTV
jgi:hypothetical protein